MNGRITKIKDTFTKYGGDPAFYIFWKLEDGRSARTYCAPTFNGAVMRNYTNWIPIRKRFDAGEQIRMKDLIIKEQDGTAIVDADSIFHEYKEPVVGQIADQLFLVTWRCPACSYTWSKRVSPEIAKGMRVEIEHNQFPACEHCELIEKIKKREI